MNIRERLWHVRHGPICRIGGSKSQSTASTSQNYDQRSIVTNTLDGGAIAGALGFASQVAGTLGSVATSSINGSNSIASQALDASTAQSAHAYDYADNLFSNAIDFAQGNDNRAMSAYDRAAAVQTSALGLVQTAYADAKGTSQSQQQIMLAVLAVAGVAVLATIQAKG